MQPFAPEDLAQPDDYKFRGYIPVDHSMFQGENTFTGETPVDEDVPDVSRVPSFYIDELEDAPDQEPDHEYHRPPFEEAPQFVEEPVLVFPAPVRAPQPVRAPAPQLRHIFHEPRAPVAVEPVRFTDARPRPHPGSVIRSHLGRR